MATLFDRVINRGRPTVQDIKQKQRDQPKAPYVKQSKPSKPSPKPYQPKTQTKEEVSKDGTVKRVVTTETYDKQRGIQKTYFDPSSQYQQAGIDYAKVSEEFQEVEPFRFYRLQGKPGLYPGFVLQRMGKAYERKSETYSNIGSSLQRKGLYAQREWHPDTKIVKDVNKGTFSVSFPYAGAEKYGTYKRSLEGGGFAGLFATAWTPEDFLGVPSAVETIRGDKQKALDIKIQSLARVEDVGKGKWYERVGKGALWYVESPIGTIGLSIAGGYAIPQAGAFIKGAAAAKGVWWGRAATVGLTGTGAALIGKETVDSISTIQKGDVGKGVGRLTRLGVLISGSYAGYKLTKPSLPGIYGKGKTWYQTRKGLFKTPDYKPQMVWAKPGKKIATMTKFETFKSQATPVEQTRLKIAQVTGWKPTSKSQLIRFPKTPSDTNLVSWKSPWSQYITFPGSKPIYQRDPFFGIIYGGKQKPTLVKDILYKGDKKAFVVLRSGKPSLKGFRGYVGGTTQQVSPKQILTKNILKYDSFEDMFGTQRGQMGGYTQTKTITIPETVIPETTPTFPYTPNIPSFIPITIPITTPISKPVTQRQPVFEQKPSFKYAPVSLSIPQYKQISGSGSIQSTTPLFEKASVQKMEVGIANVTKKVFKQSPETTTKRQQLFIKQPPVIPGFFVIPKGLSGRGRLGYGDNLFGKKYKFREFKIPTLSKLLKT